MGTRSEVDTRSDPIQSDIPSSIGPSPGFSVMDMKVIFAPSRSGTPFEGLLMALEAGGVVLSCGPLCTGAGGERSVRFLFETRLQMQEAAQLALDVAGVEQVDIEPWAKEHSAHSGRSAMPAKVSRSGTTMESVYEMLQGLVGELDGPSGERSNLILEGGTVPIDGAEPTDLAIVLLHLFQHITALGSGYFDLAEARGVAVSARRSATRSLVELTPIEPLNRRRLDERSIHLTIAEHISRTHGWSLSFAGRSGGHERLAIRLGPGPQCAQVMVAMDAGLIFAIQAKDVHWVVRVPQSSLRDMKVQFQGSTVPLVRLSEFCEAHGPCLGIVLRMGHRQACLLVSSVLGLREFLPEQEVGPSSAYPFLYRGMLDCFIKVPLLDTARLLSFQSDPSG